MVGVVKDNTDQDSWFSAKPITVGNLINILAGTEFNLRQGGVASSRFILHILGDREDFISEYVDSEWQRWILNYQTQNDKVVCQKGNSPEQELRFLNYQLSENKRVFIKVDKEIGLEAAIIL